MAKARGTGKKRQSTGASRAAGSRKRPAKSAARKGAQSGWPPGKFALWSQRWSNPNETTILLRHPTAPFVGRLDQIDDAGLQNITYLYLVAANNPSAADPPLGLPKALLDSLKPGQKSNKVGIPIFSWLPIGWPTQDQQVSSLVSFEALRGSSSDPDRIIIMLAAQRLSFFGLNLNVGFGYGIRVVAHVRKDGTKYQIRITGMSATLPVDLSSPKTLIQELSTRAKAASFLRPLIGMQAKNAMASTAGVEGKSLSIRGLRFSETPDAHNGVQVEFYATSTKTSQKTTPYSYVFSQMIRRDRDDTLIPGPLALVSKVELVADAWQPTPGHARVFPRDPASQPDPGSHRGAGTVRHRRPTRSEKELDEFRCEEEITPNARDPLELPLPPVDPEETEVLVCPGFVLADNPGAPGHPHPGDVKEVDLPDTGPDQPYIRTNDFAAISAYKNVRQFFLRLDAYGMDPHLYFRIAKLPLKVFYRSGIRPGPGKDGQTVNARVLAEGFSVDFEGPTPPDMRPGLEMHLALADLSTRSRRPWNGRDRSAAEPLGIAADPRWIWHEIGHVLLMASVGELQFRFAHSAGDALAAIVCDPRSTLATSSNWRGVTFPWVFLPRRHDRCVLNGWGWGGELHYDLAQVQDSVGPRRKAYWSEQILSSSLFRLYRCIGGDTTRVGSTDDPDVITRESASNYSVYLIMRGIQILGTSGVAPANQPDQYVSALIDADINTDLWDVNFTPEYCEDICPQTPILQFNRIGGCVHKVVRWAFEAQGLYRSFTNEPGYPPPVDIYIPDLRPPTEITLCGEVDYGSGGSYNAVSLDWDPNQSPVTATPKWQADPAAISVAPNGKISVVVRNRGTMPALGVSVSVWWHAWPAGSAVPAWDAMTWKQCALTGAAIQDIPPKGQAEFRTFAAVPLPPGRRYLLLAQATCADDPANTDPATDLPCSKTPTPLIDLVANDNNLGLRVLQR